MTHDQDTMSKIYSALARAGLSHQQVLDVVSDMQNQGILFRERNREAMTQPPLFQAPLGMDNRVHPSGIPSVDYRYKEDPGGESGVLAPTNFQDQAKDAVAEYYNQFLAGGQNYRHPLVTKDDIFVVWFVKVLQNWKALCSTVFEDDRYFELTYNGDKRELYVDEYRKKGNEVFVLNIPSQRVSTEHC